MDDRRQDAGRQDRSRGSQDWDDEPQRGVTTQQRQGSETSRWEGSRGSGDWQGYVVPYRYYGPGYQGVGYYSVMYQGPGDEGDFNQDQEQGRQAQRGSRQGSYAGRGGYEQGWEQGGYQQGGFDQGRSGSGGSRQSGAGQGGSGGYWESGYGRSGYGGQRGQGGYAGRGPKNYQRSDDRLREEVCDRLMEHDQLDASDVDVQVRGGEVTLSGTVPDRSMKRFAEDAAEGVTGVRDVMNQLRVEDDRSGDRSSGQRAATSGRSSSSRSTQEMPEEQHRTTPNGKRQPAGSSNR